MMGKMPQEGINPIEFPEQLDFLWGWFLSLHSGRQQAMDGIAPIAESEIGWFFLNRRIDHSGWEADAIRRIDCAAIGALRSGDK